MCKHITVFDADGLLFI